VKDEEVNLYELKGFFMNKILIADDEPDILEIMTKKIKAVGYDVVTAVDGQIAWEKIVFEKPDVVLLDLTMPRLDGFEVLKKLRKNPPFEKWCPVIIVSAHDELENIQKGFELEAEHYLTKPCSTGEILKAIELVLSLRGQRIGGKEE
jgi:two-component system alkaline phosphatase synthesis response regulator PhoP